MSSTLLATLGGQPQLITFALDALLAMGEAIDELIVLHLSRPRISQSLTTLSHEFVGDYYTHAQQPCRFRPIPLRDGDGKRLPDIQTRQQAIDVSKALLELVAELKEESRLLHVFTAGGRRLMALTLVPVAQLHFGYDDKLWHIHMPEAFKAKVRGGKMMHAQPQDGVRLIRLPLLPLGVQFPAIKALATLTEPPKRARMSQAERQRCEAVWQKLTNRPRKVLELLAAGLTPDEVAQQLHIVQKTVQAHQTTIFSECRIAWQLPDDKHLTYHFVRDKFGPFID